MELLTVSGISIEGQGQPILKDISFNQRKRQKIAIAGETGSGKSSLLKVIAGLMVPDNGEVSFEGEHVRYDRLVPGHPGIAYLSQHFELPKSLRVEQVLSYSNTFSDSTATTLYEVCQIDHLMTRRTDQLSGGERQRIAMARLLISSPRLLLLDEPFSHLDIPHKNTLKTVIHDLSRKLKIACMLVSHDPADTLSWADKILVMKEGQLIQQGSPERIYNHPVNEYTASLFGRYTKMTPELLKVFEKQLRHTSFGDGLFLRPEHFRLVKKASGAVKGVLKELRFFGSHYEATVYIGTNALIVHTDNPDIKKGGTVYVTL
ncbi:MAG TPA: ABC transporter ATP-binding protein [Ohtaekwangia sp.]|nr:ABC transporter ATP-binding protein [Ohtaekwangia sp.]